MELRAKKASIKNRNDFVETKVTFIEDDWHDGVSIIKR